MADDPIIPGYDPDTDDPKSDQISIPGLDDSPPVSKPIGKLEKVNWLTRAVNLVVTGADGCLYALWARCNSLLWFDKQGLPRLWDGGKDENDDRRPILDKWYSRKGKGLFHVFGLTKDRRWSAMHPSSKCIDQVLVGSEFGGLRFENSFEYFSKFRLPAGITSMWFGPKECVPDGWLPLDGQTYDEGDYPALEKIFPLSGGKLCLPDTRGLFVRGVDEGIGRDTGANNRSGQCLREGGDRAGTVQDWTIPSHKHTATATTSLGIPYCEVSIGAGSTTDLRKIYCFDDLAIDPVIGQDSKIRASTTVEFGDDLFPGDGCQEIEQSCENRPQNISTYFIISTGEDTEDCCEDPNCE